MHGAPYHLRSNHGALAWERQVLLTAGRREIPGQKPPHARRLKMGTDTARGIASHIPCGTDRRGVALPCLSSLVSTRACEIEFGERLAPAIQPTRSHACKQPEKKVERVGELAPQQYQSHREKKPLWSLPNLIIIIRQCTSLLDQNT